MPHTQTVTPSIVEDVERMDSPALRAARAWREAWEGAQEGYREALRARTGVVVGLVEGGLSKNAAALAVGGHPYSVWREALIYVPDASPEALSGPRGSAAALEAQEGLQAAQEAVDSLRAQRRDIGEQLRAEGLRTYEVAAALGIGVDQVYVDRRQRRKRQGRGLT